MPTTEAARSPFGGATNLTVGGLPGTGTTTLCRLLAERTGLPYTYAGALFRAEAERRGMSLAEFGALCEADPAVDQALDEQQIGLLRQGGQLLEGRLSGWLSHREGLSDVRVWLTCDDDERIRRLVDRDGADETEQRRRIREREASEAARYQNYYDIDLGDMSPYALVLDSTDTSPDDLADSVTAAWSIHA